MVSETIICPHCGKAEAVVRHRYNRGGTARCCCKRCDKTFTPKPNPRAVTPEKRQAILDALCERLSMEAIARMLHVSKTTIYDTLKKTAGTAEPAVSARPALPQARRG